MSRTSVISAALATSCSKSRRKKVVSAVCGRVGLFCTFALFCLFPGFLLENRSTFSLVEAAENHRVEENEHLPRSVKLARSSRSLAGRDFKALRNSETLRNCSSAARSSVPLTLFFLTSSVSPSSYSATQKTSVAPSAPLHFFSFDDTLGFWSSDVSPPQFS